LPPSNNSQEDIGFFKNTVRCHGGVVDDRASDPYRLACVDDALAMAELVGMADGRMAGHTLNVLECAVLCRRNYFIQSPLRALSRSNQTNSEGQLSR